MISVTIVINDEGTREGTLSQLHRLLRDATQLPHRALDRHPLLAPLLTRELTVLQYGAALAALHGVYAEVEDLIMAFLDQHPGLFDYRSRRKLPALELDLAELGRTGVPARMKFTAPQNVGALIGLLYTIEGSTHGGQFIARSVQQLHGGNLPLRFFTGYGARTSQSWKDFLAFAAGSCPPAEFAAAMSTAGLLFQAIKDHLDAADLRP